MASTEAKRFFALREGKVSDSQQKAVVYGFLGLLIIYVVIRGVVGALWRPLWYDELYTLTIASQANLHDWWRAVQSGFDSAPPAFYLVERAALHVTRHTELNLRLPSILAFPVTLVSIFIYARRRTGDIAALLCAMSLLPTLLFNIYTIEGRAYSMVIACMAVALVCYQRIGTRGWAVLFGLALVAAELLHYFAVFAMIPFWIAEGVMVLRTRRFRWGVWLPLVCAMVPLIVFFPMLLRIKANYGPHVFARPVFIAIEGYYAAYFLLNRNRLGIALVLLAIAAVIRSALIARDAEHAEKTSVEETALLVSLVALPCIMFVPLKFMGGILLNRYALVATLGVAVGMAMAFSNAGRKGIVIYGLLVVSVAGLGERSFWLRPEHYSFSPYFSATSASALGGMKKVIEDAGRTTSPIVVSDCLLQAQFVYYFEPKLTDRMVYLLDPERELRVTKADTSSRTQLLFSKFFPLKVANFSAFTSNHEEFLFYRGALDWNTRVFLENGYSMELLGAQEGYGAVYLVKTTKGAPR